jgi:hypothetical protein
MGLTVSVPLRFRLPLQRLEHFSIDTTYRYSNFRVSSWPKVTLPSGVQVDNVSSDDGFAQHEIYLSAGVEGQALALFGHYASLHDGSQYLSYSNVAGLSLRYSTWGDITLESSIGFYSDMTVSRVSPTWRLPVLSWLAVTPSVALQVAHTDRGAHDQLDHTTELLATGMLVATVTSAQGQLSLGGKFGDEVRPCYLDIPVVYNHPDRNAFGAWATGTLVLGHGWSLHLAYEFERLETPVSATERVGNNVHRGTIGIAWNTLNSLRGQ